MRSATTYPSRHRRVAMVTAICLGALGACGTSEPGADTMLFTSGDAATTSASTTTTTTPSSSPTTVPLTTTPPTTPPPTTPPPTTPPPTTPPATSAPTTLPPTTLPPATVAPTGPGVGAAAIDTSDASVFGVAPFEAMPTAESVSAVSRMLGDPTSDTGALPTPEAFACTGSETYRVVRWGDLRMSFVQGRTSTEATAEATTESDRMLAWALGDDSVEQLAPNDDPPSDLEPTGLTTLEGVGVGSMRSDLEAVFTEDQTVGFDDDRITVRTDAGAAPGALWFDLVGDTVVGIGTGPLDCLDPDETR